MNEIREEDLSKIGLSLDNQNKLKYVIERHWEDFFECPICIKKGTDIFKWGYIEGKNYNCSFMQTPIGFFIKLKNSTVKIEYHINNKQIETVKVKTLVDFKWTSSYVLENNKGNFTIVTSIIDNETIHKITSGRTKLLNSDMDLYDETITRASNEIIQEAVESEIEAESILELFSIFAENPYQLIPISTPRL